MDKVSQRGDDSIRRLLGDEVPHIAESVNLDIGKCALPAFEFLCAERDIPLPQRMVVGFESNEARSSQISPSHWLALMM